MTETDKPQNDQKKISGGYKFLLDFGPVLAFFFGFKTLGMMTATAIFMGATLISMAIHWVVERHVPKMLVITAVIVLLMGGLTLWLNDPTFVKMKLTIINGLIAAILLGGLLRGKSFLQSLLGSAIIMQDVGWRIFTRNYAFFCLFIAGTNEVIWRTQSDDFWVNFKTFGAMPMIMVFFVGQMVALHKYIDMDAMEDKDDKGSE